MDDIWRHILSYLTPSEFQRCERVCVEWRRRVKSARSTVREMDVHKEFPEIMDDPKRIISLLEQFQGLRTIIFHVPAIREYYQSTHSDKHITSGIIKTLGQCNGLRSITFSRMILTLGALDSIFQLPENLQEISISHCRLCLDTIEEKEMAQESFKTLFRKCKRLKKLEILSRGHSMEDFVTTDILECLPNSLEHLCISASFSLIFESLHFLKNKRIRHFVLQRSYIDTESLKFLLPLASCLEHLDLSYNPGVQDFSTLGGLSNLRTLIVGNNRDGMSDESLCRIINGCPLLGNLSVENCPKLTTQSLKLLGYLTELENIYLCGLSAVCDSVLQILSTCRRLKVVDIKYCRNVTSIGVRYLLTLPLLEQLEVDGVRLSSEMCQELKRSHVRVIGIQCSSVIVPGSIVLPPIPSVVSA